MKLSDNNSFIFQPSEEHGNGLAYSSEGGMGEGGGRSAHYHFALLDVTKTKNNIDKNLIIVFLGKGEYLTEIHGTSMYSI